MARPSLLDLTPDEYNHGLYYYPFLFNLDRCNGCSNTFYDTSYRICVINKTDDANLSVLIW